MSRATTLCDKLALASRSVLGKGAARDEAFDASPSAGGGGSAARSIPQSPAAKLAAIATYGFMSAAVCRYSRRVEDGDPGMARMAHVRFSIPHDAVSGAHTPGT